MPKVKKKSFIQKNGLIAVWAMAGFIAMGYIGFLVSTGNINQSRLIAKNSASPDKVAELEAEVSRLKKKEAQLSQQVAKLEDAASDPTFTSAVPEKVEKSRPSGYGIDDEPSYAVPQTPGADTEKVSVKVLPLTASDTVDTIFDDSGKSAYGLDFATAKSIDFLERHWDYMKRSLPDLLEGLKPHYTRRSAGNQPLYALVVGPFAQKSAADGRCKEMMMRSSDLECRSTPFETDFQDKIQAASRIGAAVK